MLSIISRSSGRRNGLKKFTEGCSPPKLAKTGGKIKYQWFVSLVLLIATNLLFHAIHKEVIE